MRVMRSREDATLVAMFFAIVALVSLYLLFAPDPAPLWLDIGTAVLGLLLTGIYIYRTIVIARSR